jgi:hypothetical protein
VDQATGNVYAFDGERNNAGDKQIQVYNTDGTELITEFGEYTIGQTTAASPAKLHGVSAIAGGIAVDASGNVYVFDINSNDSFRYRLMKFQPQTPGDYTHYVYAGVSQDVDPGTIEPGHEANLPSRPVTDAAGDLYVAGEDYIEKFDPTQPTTPPLCTFTVPNAGVRGMNVNPETGEIFYYNYKDRKVHRLSACNQGEIKEVEAFGPSPKRGYVEALAVNPTMKWEPSRPQSVLYGATPEEIGEVSGGEPGQSALGYIFAPPVSHEPVVESESVSNIGVTTATLRAQINPKGAPTSYAFQYLAEAAYQANEPEERQSLTIRATGGLFGLGFEGRRLGGPATANLTAGSKTATALRTATATATLKGAVGTGTLKGATGKGTLIAGSSVIASVSTSKGSFEVGQGIAGEGIPAKDEADHPIDTTIIAVKPEEGLPTKEITISTAADKSLTHVNLSSGAAAISEVNTNEGSFEVGQAIAGGSIPEGSKITAVKAGELTLSKPATAAAAGLTFRAGLPVLTSVSAGIGSFEVNQKVEGEGIPANTTIEAVKGNELTLSKPTIKPGTGVAISSPGPAPLAAGERIEGPGIPPNTTIASIKAGEATLSNPATASGTNVLLHAGLPADVSVGGLRRALEALPTVGEHNVKVGGGPGDETGTNPYEILFSGDLGNVDVPQLSAENLTLSGGSATATVQTGHDGGGGFAQGASEAPIGGAVLGGGQSPLLASAAVSGLAPDTAYRYRAVATSLEGTGSGKAEAFHTSPAEAPGLPDHRAYELVSPAKKDGGEVFPANPNTGSCGDICKPGGGSASFPMQSSPSGEAVVYEGSAFSFEGGAVRENEYLSKRTPSGWQTTALSPSLQGSGEGFGPKAFNAELTKGFLYQGVPTLSPDAPAEYSNLYAQPTGAPSALEPLLLSAPPNRPPGPSLKLTYAGASADFSQIFFEANDALTEATEFAPAAVDGGIARNNLYEWEDGQLRLVNVLPGNAEAPPGAAFGGRRSGNTAAVLVHAISEDGSRVFWEDESGQAYLREDGKVTRAISTAGVPDPGKFLAASPDGSQVLLGNGHLHGLGDEEPTLDLTQGKGGFQGIAGQSEDLSRIYFVDTAVLSGEEENDQGAQAQAGANNLYAWHQGTTAFIATLLASDGSEERGDWAPSPVQRSAEASPDGRWLAFQSQAPLSGYDNTGPCKVISGTKEVVDGPCTEVFLYDSAEGKLSCPSCRTSGERPLGGSSLTRMWDPDGSLPQPRYLADSGRLYFDSRDSLTPFDTNEGVEDVYQFEPNGIGTCKREAGCVSLISAGSEGIDSNFLAMDSSGKNVFFTSRDQLTQRDEDELVDLYVAREDGGIPSETETARGECQGEACQPQAVAPNDPTPGSSSLAGAGNVEERKAVKHKKKKRKHGHKRAQKHKRGGGR